MCFVFRFHIFIFYIFYNFFALFFSLFLSLPLFVFFFHLKPFFLYLLLYRFQSFIFFSSGSAFLFHILYIALSSASVSFKDFSSLFHCLLRRIRPSIFFKFLLSFCGFVSITLVFIFLFVCFIILNLYYLPITLNLLF